MFSGGHGAWLPRQSSAPALLQQTPAFHPHSPPSPGSTGPTRPQATIILIAPFWPSQFWFLDLLRLYACSQTTSPRTRAVSATPTLAPFFSQPGFWMGLTHRQSLFDTGVTHPYAP
ncbi:hypothetical protein G0U57_017676 [Chelydra serpentina]|uniref:Uncharacterized protein n=1 Tax=Chelydra serpentina TaxID=8475 RepID=A0A8T1S5H7_CHESE|nr:hypothetical protein G0U57_017676 [Chelydra serpentina]